MINVQQKTTEEHSLPSVVRFTTNPVVQMKENFLQHLFFSLFYNNIAADMQKDQGPVLASKKRAQIDGFFPHFTLQLRFR